MLVASDTSMAMRVLLLCVCKAARDAVVRLMAESTLGGEKIHFLHDQLWARVTAVLIGKPLFLTGSAGVGKTATSSTILDDLQTFDERPSERKQRMLEMKRHVEACKELKREHRVAVTQAAVLGRPPPAEPELPKEPLGPDGKSVMVLASTGTAAQLINGRTVHSVFNVGVERKRADGQRVLPEHEAGELQFDDTEDVEVFGNVVDYEEDMRPGEWHVIRMKNNTRTRLRKTDVILCDEVSMLDADLLDLMDEACRIARGNEEPFGGILVVLIGDLAQLAPVVTPNMAKNGGVHGFLYKSKAWRNLSPYVVNLTTPVRQRAVDDDAARFISILNNARFGKVEWADVNWLQRNGHKTSESELPLLLTTRSRIRDTRNALMLGRQEGETCRRDVQKFSSYCDRFCVRFGFVEEGKQVGFDDFRAWKIVDMPNVNVTFNKDAVKCFEFKVGARVQCTKNTYSGSGDERYMVVANGSVGEIVAVETHASEPELVTSIDVRWDPVRRDGMPFVHAMTPVWYARLQARPWRVEDKVFPAKTLRLQFALRICYAKNTYAAQGSSIYRPADVCIDQNKYRDKETGALMRTHGLIYTCLSRFGSHKDMRHLPLWGGMAFKPDNVFCDPEVVEFYEKNSQSAPEWLKQAVGSVRLV